MPRYKLKIRHHFKDIVRGELVLPSVGIYLLKGPVGSGKTSILRELYFHQNKKHTFSYQTLDFPFAPGIKVIDHINMVKNATSIDGDKLEKILMKFNIYNLLENEIERLSDGEKERLMISLALAEKTPVALLDEPSARLDRLSIARLVDLLSEEKDERLILISTHREDFEQLSSGTYSISDKKLIKPQEEIIKGKLKLTKRNHHKKRYPKSRMIQMLMLGITTVTSAISISALVPSMEYLSPTPENFYYGPKDFSPTCYIPKKCDNCNEAPLYHLDFYYLPSYLHYVYDNATFSIYISDFYGDRKVITLKNYQLPRNIYVESIDSMDFAISRGFYRLLEKIHLNFDSAFFDLGGISNPKVFEDEGVYIKYPEALIHNLSYMQNSHGNERYASPEDKFFDYQMKPRNLEDDQVAYNYNSYFEGEFGGPNNPTDEGKKTIFFRGPIGLKRIIKKDYDYQLDQINIFRSSYVAYSRSGSPNSAYLKYYDLVDSFDYYKSLYQRQIKMTNLNLSFIIPLPVLVISILLVALCQILESQFLRSKRDLYLYYNSSRSSLLHSLSIIDPVICLFMVPILFASISLFIPVISPTINFLLGIGFIISIAVVFSLSKLFISFIIHLIRRKRLR